MYTPVQFAVHDRAAQLAMIDRYPFGTLITTTSGTLRISTIPFLLERNGQALIGHVARENPHWQEFAAASDLLVSFVGPNAYVSPNWYRSENMVPTWNYAAVEVRGKAELLESRPARLDVVDRLAARHEAQFERPWHSSKLEPTLRDKLLDAIVAFRIDITQITAKAKLGQNRSIDDVRSAAAALARRDVVPQEHALAALMLDAMSPG